jgi:dCTP deaminase
MIKNDCWIRNFGINKGIVPFNLEQINPASYDVTLGNHWIFPKENGSIHSIFSKQIILHSNEVVLASTNECITLPRNVCCDLKLKSTMGRKFLNHTLAGWIDPGFNGEITLELHNIGPQDLCLQAFTRIAQIIFFTMEAEPEIAYGENGKGKYQYQCGPTLAKE